MSKSKRKHINHFEDYLWQTEQILWMGKPEGSRWRYGRHLPAPYLSERNHSIQQWAKLATYIFAWLGVFIGTFNLMMTIADINSGSTGMTLSLILGVPCLLWCIAIGLYFLPYIFPSEIPFYAITNRRVLVLHNGRCREMQHELIRKVRIDKHLRTSTLTWDEGQVDFFPSFVGIRDAEYLVQLVEEAQNKYIPIVRKTWNDTVIYH